MVFRQLFRLTRTMQGITQTKVAEAVGISHQAVNSFEKGSTSLSIATLRKMAISVNINPDCLSDPSTNPFLSNKLIKMEFPENLFIPGLNFQIIYFMAEKNKLLKIIFLFSNSILTKKILKGMVFENPVIAITCQDINKNIFLLKRKKSVMAPIVGDRELRLELSKYINDKKSVIIKDLEVNDVLLKKIRDGSVTKEELEPLFGEGDDIVLDEGERMIILKKREKKISNSELLSYIENIAFE